MVADFEFQVYQPLRIALIIDRLHRSFHNEITAQEFAPVDQQGASYVQDGLLLLMNPGNLH